MDSEGFEIWFLHVFGSWVFTFQTVSGWNRFKFKAVQSFVIFGFDSTLVWTHCFNFSSKYEVLNAQGRPDEALRLVDLV